jgi:PhnB protein
MKEVTTYLNFDGNCREAMEFYSKCLKSPLEISPYPDAQGKPSTDPAAPVMHARLTHAGASILMASDNPPGASTVRGGNFSVAIHCDSVEEIDGLFNALAQNGKVRMALANAPWGARFGMLTDQFGIQWMLNCPLNQAG